ncbi:MAG: hypothetical protein Q4F74_07840, partial [Synergistaceae bacterium]|nr:hypothetical protein [Synergistaceae bacterium]
DKCEVIKNSLDSENNICCDDADDPDADIFDFYDYGDRGVKSYMICYIISGELRRAALTFEFFKKHAITQEEKTAGQLITQT